MLHPTFSQHNITFFFSLLIASCQLNTFVNMMPPSPAALQKLITTKLSLTQLANAYGRYSQLKSSPMSYAAAKTWFGPNASANIKQFISSSHDTAGLLLYSKGMFHVISGASFCLDASEKLVVTGTLRDKILNIVPLQVDLADVLGSIYVLFHDDESTTGLLGNHLLATTHLATDTIMSAANNEYSFFGNANLINVPDLANMQVTILPVAIPLPFGHGLNGTSIFDGQGMVKLVDQLTKIDPCYGIWLTVMHLSLQYLEGLSLHHQSLNIRPEYFEPLNDQDQLRMEIPISLIPIIPTQGSTPQLIDVFNKVQESIMEKWVKLDESKPLYDDIMKLAPFFSGALTPAGTLPSGHVPQVHVVTPASCSDQQTKIKVKEALAFAKLLMGERH
jgi:hypothetical protein